MTKTVLVSGYFGFGNLGDEAILEGVVAELRRRDPGTHVIATFGPARATAERLGAEAIDFFDGAALAEAVSRSSLLLFGLGGVFQDYWGAYAGMFFQPGTNGVEAYVRPAVQAHLSGVPSVLFCAGVGPLRTDDGRRMFALGCGLADALVVRDEGSAAEVRGAGVARPVVVARDPAYLLEATAADRAEAARRLAAAGVHAPYVPFALRSWTFGNSDDDVLAAVAGAVAGLPSGWTPLFVPFHRDGGSDPDFARRAAEACGRGVVFEVDTPGQAIALFEGAEAVVAMRAHAVLFAALAGTPAVALAYDPKVAAAAADLGLSRVTLRLDELARLGAAVEDAAGDPELRRTLAVRRERARALARNAFHLAEQCAARTGAPAPAEERAARLEAELGRIHGSKMWRLASLYWAAARGVHGVARRLGGIARPPDPPPPGPPPPAPLPAEPDPPGVADAPRPPPAPEPPTATPKVLDAPVAREDAYDVLCLPIIDWDFRFQRPQQLMARFAAAGHRVFYVNLAFRADGPAWTLAAKRDNVYEVSLRGPARNVYKDALDDEAGEALFASLDALRRDLGLGATATVVQLPFWWPLARRARERFAWPVIYDCMDHHAGFDETRPEMLAAESELMASADVVSVSSAALEQEALRHNPRVLLVRNACDYEHFAIPSRPRGDRPVIGYYGAIAEWFDVDLVADLARRRPDWSFVLVGATYGADVAPLSGLANVSLPGEQPYAAIPGWLAQFDVALIPFKRGPLTEATNPVKAYEILASGRPIVSVPIPEMALLGPLARLASTADEFERAIEESLQPADAERAESRRAFARRQTWADRFAVLEPAVRGAFPLVSVVVVTFDNLALNRQCLESLFARTEWPGLQVIVVDNASRDGTREYLDEARARHPRLRVVLNEANEGFAAANNRGLQEAEGAFLVLLNNDTVVSRGWLSALLRHLASDPGIGLAGPVTNEVGNEAKVVPAPYADVADMPAWAARYVREHDGQTFEIPMLAMFCVALRRSVYDAVGPLDERFGIGMFEDDDYARRVREKGYRLVCCRDSFVHHWGRASFGRLPEPQYDALFARNRRLFEDKWGEPWTPHRGPAGPP